MKKIILYSLVFFLGTFVLGIVVKRLDLGRVKSVKFQDGRIENFIFVNKNSSKSYFRGKVILEEKNMLNIYTLDGYVKKGDKKVYIFADRALIDNKNKLITLYKNVNIKDENFLLFTKKLHIDTQKGIAYNNTTCEIKTENSYTKGNNIFINLNTETLTLENVITTVKE